MSTNYSSKMISSESSKASKSQKKKMKIRQREEKFFYVLFIKRGVYMPDQMMGIFSSIAKAKKTIKSIFIAYHKSTNYEDNEVEQYDAANWEHCKNDKRYWFYCLNSEATAYFTILKVPLDSCYASVFIKRSTADTTTTTKEKEESKGISTTKDVHDVHA